MPVPAHPLHQAAQHPPGAFGHFMAPPPDVGRLQDLAVDVELQLTHGAVSHPDGPRAQVARQMIELTLDQVSASVDAVHDLQVSAAFVPADALQEAHERVGLGAVAHGVQRGEGERRVAEPHEPVVPVPDPADGLGQRGRRRGDDSARLRMGEQLEGQGGATNHRAVGAPIAHGRAPALPVARRDVELARALVAVHRMDVVIVVTEHQPARVSALEREARDGDRGGPGDRPVERPRAGERQHLIGPVGREEPRAELFQPGRPRAVLEPGREDHLHRHRSAYPAHVPVDLGMRTGGAAVLVHRHEVGDGHHAARRPEGGLEDVGEREVTLGGGPRHGGPHRPGAAPLGIQ